MPHLNKMTIAMTTIAATLFHLDSTQAVTAADRPNILLVMDK